MNSQIEYFSRDFNQVCNPPSTQFPAESSSSIPSVLIQTAISIASVRASRAQDDAERREALAEVDSYIAQVSR